MTWQLRDQELVDPSFEQQESDLARAHANHEDAEIGAPEVRAQREQDDEFAFR
jgi:hypothetical protein